LHNHSNEYILTKMDEPHLYQQVASYIRQQILTGTLQPGDRIPSVREMAIQWGCTIGTIQRAYQELVRHGLVVSRPGQGTRIVEKLPDSISSTVPLRRAALVHRAESYLLEMLTAGFELAEIEDAIREAMDRWHTKKAEANKPVKMVLRFSGSHDLVITWLASHFPEIAPGHVLNLSITGSLGGLIALAEGNADLAGSHLWDEHSDTYNIPFVNHILPGKKMALVTIAHRRQGFILPPGNPLNIQTLDDLAKPGLRFVNRQGGSGTRVWLDSVLRQRGIDTGTIAGYNDEKQTHSAVALSVAEGQADVGIGLEAAALSYRLDFVFLHHDRYDLVIPFESMELQPIRALVGWLQIGTTHKLMRDLGGYDTEETGMVRWTE